MARRVLRRLRGSLVAAAGPALAAAIEAPLRRTALRAGVAIAYHRVGAPPGDPEAQLDPALDPAVLERQLAHLAARYRVVPASRLAAAVRMRRRGEPFPVAVTFDDDLASHLTHAVPALASAGVTATFFLNGVSLDGPHSFWWDRLERAMKSGAPLPPPADASRPIAQTGLLVEELPAAEREAFSERLLDAAGPDPGDSGLRAGQVEQIAAASHEIGFHTPGHHRLTQLDDEQLQRELREGRDRLAELAGSPLETIAYPHGRADERVAKAARAAGYATGFTTEPRAVTPTTPLLLQGRLDAPLDSPGRLAAGVARLLARAMFSAPESGSRAMTDARRAAIGEGTGRAARRAAARPPVGRLDLGGLRTTEPISAEFGFDRGTPVDRRYIEAFMGRHAAAVRGRVLEVGDDGYTRRFGGEAIERVDVLHGAPGNPQATIVADLADAPELPDATYDCAICTQTLLLVYDVRAAVATLHRVLRPGGTALVTLPGVSRLCAGPEDPWGDYWRFTSMSARRLFEDEFGAAGGTVDVEPYGNVLAATAQLQGIAAEELDPAELDVRDPAYEVLIAVCARKAATA